MPSLGLQWHCSGRHEIIKCVRIPDDTLEQVSIPPYPCVRVLATTHIQPRVEPHPLSLPPSKQLQYKSCGPSMLIPFIKRYQSCYYSIIARAAFVLPEHVCYGGSCSDKRPRPSGRAKVPSRSLDGNDSIAADISEQVSWSVDDSEYSSFNLTSYEPRILPVNIYFTTISVYQARE